jgi:hypothetical protein
MKGYQKFNPGPPSTSGRVTSNPANGDGTQAQGGGAIGGSPELRSPTLRGKATWGFGGKMMWGQWGFYPR